MHATGSRSFTQTLRAVAGNGSTRTKALFAYFNSFMTAERNSLDVLILDEAHRLRMTSVNRYTRKEVRSVARPQVDELFDVGSGARLPPRPVPGRAARARWAQSTRSRRTQRARELPRRSRSTCTAQYRAGRQ